jgi:hypothetical protein
MPWLRISGAIPLLPLYAIMEWKGQTLILLHYLKLFLETLGDSTKSLRMAGIWVEN